MASRSILTRAAAARAALRSSADQVFRRSAGAQLIAGNAIRILRDGRENYPAWEQAIAGARSTIHIEMYIIHNDRTGRHFVELLAERARAGVKVRVLYDWFGCWMGPYLGLFSPLIKAGGEVRACNPPRLSAALGWTRRNHRKYISIDGRVTYISGLCMGRMWAGQPDKGLEPWRDTGVEIIGPATAEGERGFAESWSLFGGGVEPVEFSDPGTIAPAGDVNLRLVYTEPFTASMFRVDLLVAAMARKRLWVSDAYFIGHGPYVLALQAAARDGVDVRLLVPQGSDVGWTVPVTRTLYRTLLDSGVRIFEWNGSMMHAKTAVADSQWSRIGSTNLNLNSWVGNWELDVAMEDAGVAAIMERHYEEDLERSREILADSPGRERVVVRGPGRTRRVARRALRAATGMSHSISAAVMGSRQLEAWEVSPLMTIGLVLLASAAAGIWKPSILAWPLVFLCLWIGVSFVAQALGLFRGKNLP